MSEFVRVLTGWQRCSLLWWWGNRRFVALYPAFRITLGSHVNFLLVSFVLKGTIVPRVDRVENIVINIRPVIL